jgi:hypothetical protein
MVELSGIDRAQREPARAGAPKRPGARELVPGILLSAVVPVVVYLALRGPLGSATLALATGAAVPILYTAVRFAVRRRLDPVGAVSVVGFAVALGVTALSGGNPLMLELQDAVITGPLGIIALGSVAIRRPLLMLVPVLRARRDPAVIAHLRASGRLRGLAVLTAILGTLMIVHALVLLVLALSLPVATYLAVSKPAGWGVLGLGLAIFFWYRTRLNRRSAGA